MRLIHVRLIPRSPGHSRFQCCYDLHTSGSFAAARARFSKFEPSVHAHFDDAGLVPLDPPEHYGFDRPSATNAAKWLRNSPPIHGEISDSLWLPGACCGDPLAKWTVFGQTANHPPALHDFGIVKRKWSGTTAQTDPPRHPGNRRTTSTRSSRRSVTMNSRRASYLRGSPRKRAWAPPRSTTCSERAAQRSGSISRKSTKNGVHSNNFNNSKLDFSDYYSNNL